MILISHDRDFLQGLTNRIFEFTENGIKEHIGDIYDFLEEKKAEDFRAYESAKSASKVNSTPVSKPTHQHVSNVTANDKDLKALKNKANKLENAIAALDTKIAAYEDKLKDPEQFKTISNDANFYKDYEEAKAEQCQLMQDWEDVLGQLEN